MKKKERIDKILSNSGYGTRKEVKKFIKKGLVTVNDNLIKDPGIHVDPDRDIIKLENKKVEYKKYIYIMLNKPAGVISATFDNFQRTVLDLLDERYSHYKVFPVGRLDKDTEGLLLLTNDGKLAHELLSPKKRIPKTYFAIVKGKVTEEDKKIFQEGVILDDNYKTLPSKLEILKEGSFSEVKITIFEGKYHQVKRMFKAVKKEVTYLKRLSMGNLKLDPSLNLGEYRELTAEELKNLGV